MLLLVNEYHVEFVFFEIIKTLTDLIVASADRNPQANAGLNLTSQSKIEQFGFEIHTRVMLNV